MEVGHAVQSTDGKHSARHWRAFHGGIAGEAPHCHWNSLECNKALDSVIFTWATQGLQVTASPVCETLKRHWTCCYVCQTPLDSTFRFTYWIMPSCLYIQTVMEMNRLRWISESALNKMTTEIVALVEQAHVRLWNRGTLHSAPANGCPKRQAQSTCRGMEVQSRVAHRQTGTKFRYT